MTCFNMIAFPMGEHVSPLPWIMIGVGALVILCAVVFGIVGRKKK